MLHFIMLSQPALVSFFFFNDTATTEIYTLSLHDALPIFVQERAPSVGGDAEQPAAWMSVEQGGTVVRQLGVPEAEHDDVGLRAVDGRDQVRSLRQLSDDDHVGLAPDDVRDDVAQRSEERRVG